MQGLSPGAALVFHEPRVCASPSRQGLPCPFPPLLPGCAGAARCAVIPPTKDTPGTGHGREEVT